jgi:hypothetical protein
MLLRIKPAGEAMQVLTQMNTHFDHDVNGYTLGPSLG